MIFAFIMFTGCLALLLLIAISSAKVNSKLLITAKELNKTLNYKNLPLVYKIKVNTIRGNYLQIPLLTNTITYITSINNYYYFRFKDQINSIVFKRIFRSDFLNRSKCITCVVDQCTTFIQYDITYNIK